SRPDRIQRRPRRIDSGKGAGAGVLRAPEYPDTRQNWNDYASSNAGDESGVYLPAPPRRVGARDRIGGVPQRQSAVLQVATVSDIPAAAWVGQVLGPVGS